MTDSTIHSLLGDEPPPRPQWSQQGAEWILDDLRWAAAAVGSIDHPQAREIADILRYTVLTDWRGAADVYSDGTTVVTSIPPKSGRRIYAPPHRRGGAAS